MARSIERWLDSPRQSRSPAVLSSPHKASLRPHVTAAKCFYEKLQNENQKIRKIGRTMKTAPFQHLQIRSIAPFPPPDILACKQGKIEGFLSRLSPYIYRQRKDPTFYLFGPHQEPSFPTPSGPRPPIHRPRKNPAVSAFNVPSSVSFFLSFLL
jgi:hypothetical protein